jgi:hypothetical protein
MIIAFLVALLFGLTSLVSGQNSAGSVPQPDHSREIANLLDQLAPGLSKHPKNLWIGVPWDERVERTHTQLILIANESPESRKSVISALIPVLNDPKEEFDLSGVDRWRFSVALLGELNAIEAIDDLVRNIGWTSYNGWPRITPVRATLVRIGEPAVPRLLSALSDPNESLRWEASEALAEIGEPSVNGLLDVSASAGPCARAWAASALGRIGGERAREAIEIAIRVETDEEAKKHLEYAVGHMDHVECLKHSSKCK